PGGQAVDQHGVLHDAGQEPGHLGEAGHVLGPEVVGPAGVDVEHADDPVPLAQEGQGDQGAEVLAVEGGDVAVAGVLPLVGHHRGHAVLGHPAGHTLADPQAHGAHHGVERRCGAAQHQLARLPVDHVDEAHVGVRRGDDDLGDAAQEVAQAEVVAAQLDDLPEQGGPAPGAHRKRPSRMAKATAWDRSLASSLRYTARTWVLIVSSPSTRRLAMALLDRPFTSSSRTSLSRWVSPRWAPAQNSPRWRRAADRATRPASEGSMTISPSSTRWRWPSSSSAVTCLVRKPLAPARRPWNRYCSSS